MRMMAAVVLVLALSTTAGADKVADDFVLTGTVAPGSVVSLRGEWTPASNAVPVFLRALNAKEDTAAGNTDLAEGVLKFSVPASLRSGVYTVRIGSDKLMLVPGTLDVEVPVVTLETINPATSYRRGEGAFDFTLVGDHFALDPCYDDVVVQGHDSIVKVRAATAEACGANSAGTVTAKTCPSGTPGARPEGSLPQGTCLWVESPRLMHIVGYPAERYQGPLTVSVRVGNTRSEPRQLVLARLSEAAILVLSAGATALLVLLVWWTVSGGLAKNKVGARRLGVFESFIFDPETNTYSLSKFQLLLFSLTFVFGYLYVFLATWLVQWRFVLPDVPQNIAALLGISGGTAIAAAGLTAARGSKGAGLQRPTGADLISNGGVVVGERFQFFVWTIVACSGFVMLLVSQDPAKVSGFPQMPDGLLYVMGISAASYLGGKAARKPGPIIQSIVVDKRSAKPILIVQGQSLGGDGRFFVDSKELPIVPGKEDLTKKKPQEDAADPKFCTELKITIDLPDIDVSKGEHRFRIVNRDGQFADITFSAEQPTIDEVFPKDVSTGGVRKLSASDALTAVIVKGANLRANSQITWQAPGETDAKDVSITRQKDETELEVSLVPGNPGTGLLTMTTPSGSVATATVTVEKGDGSGGVAVTPTPTPTPTPAPTPAPAASQAPAPASPPTAGGLGQGPEGTGSGGTGAPSAGSGGSS
jgi:hypothetical protein